MDTPEQKVLQEATASSEQRPTDRRASAQTWFMRVLQAALFIPLLLVAYRLIIQQTTAPEPPVYASAPKQRILVVHASTDTYGEETYVSALRALDYARLQYDDLDLAAEDIWPKLGQYSALVFSTEMLSTIGEAEAQQISDYVADGGGLAVIYRGWNIHLASLFGMKPTAEFPTSVEGEGGMRFQTDFMVGIKGVALSEDIVTDNVSYDVQLHPEVQVIAASAAGTPVAWLYRHGHGRVLYWNTVFLSDKEARGLIVQSVMSVQGLGVLPIANFAYMHVDDFPSAFSTEKIEPIKTEFDMTMVEFYDQVWLPDMMDLARRYGLVYTFLIPFNFNPLIRPPFDFKEWEHAVIEVDDQPLFYSVYATHLCAQEHEIGLHGYNHVSLTLENWPSEENMVMALKEARKRWEADNLGPQPIAYVPPNNIYDAAGTRALTQAFPSLKVLSGIYTGDFEEGGDRDFEPEPWNPELFDIPRWTFGYNLTPHYRFAMVSELGMMGVWTPFIHPDDVIHTAENYPHAPYHRNPKDWPWRGDHTGEKNGFYYRFVRLLDFAQEAFPWVRYVRTDESYDILRAHLENEVTVDLAAHQVVLHSTTPTYFQVRINDGRRIFLNALEGARFVHLYRGEGYTLYTLQGLKEEVRLRLLMPVGEERPTVTEPVWPTAEEQEETMPKDLQAKGLHENVRIPTPTPGPAPTTVPLVPEPTSAFLPTRTPTPEP